MQAILCGEIIPVVGDNIQNGYILLENQKIVKIGKGFEVPENCDIIDAKQLVAFPGIIDVHCHASVFEEEIGLNLQDGNESTDPITPHVRVIDAINPADRGLRRAVSGGITCICVAPGSANIVGGQMTTIKTHGTIVDEMVITETAGMKCAFGENPKRVYGTQKKMPSTRMGNLALFRELMVETQNYIRKWDEYHEKLAEYTENQTKLENTDLSEKSGGINPKPIPKPSQPDRNLKYEAMLDVFSKKIPLRAHAHQANDIITAVRLAEEFDVNIVIEHCSEGFEIADYLAKHKIPAVVGPLFGFRSKIETRHKTWTAYNKLYQHGVLVALTADHPVSPVQFQTVYATIAHREGLSEQGAFEILTINGAKILGLDDRIGSLEAGKDADIVLFSGHPLDTRSKVHYVYIDGELVYDRVRDEAERLF